MFLPIHQRPVLRAVLLLALVAIGPSVGSQCGWPPVPLNGRVTLSGASSDQDADANVFHNSGTVASYICDAGYDLIGNPSVLCGADGKWTGEMPICGSNVALRKSANQSSTARGGSALNAIDGDRSVHHDVGGTGGRCSETNSEVSPWWMADLMKSYPVYAVRITSRSCCDFQLHDIEIRVGNNTVPQRNPLCAWFPGTVGHAETKTFQCARPLTGQFVFVQMVGVEGSLSLCEAEIFSTGGDVPRESCTDSAALDKVVAFNRTCYELHLNEGNAFAKARNYCTKQNGDLWHHINKNALELISRELERKKHTMKSQMVWIGAQKEPTFTSRTWRWVTGDVVDKPQWGREQPNNYNGEQNCVVLDGGRDWLWNDVGCNLDYFHWVCMFPPLSCGHPDRKVNNTVTGQNFTLGASVQYKCPTGSVVIGSESRTCQRNGLWSDSAPTCKHVDCGPLKQVDNGRMDLLDSRTTYNASARYVCNENYTLAGSVQRTCSAKGTWEPAEPKCLYGRCPDLPAFERGSFSVSGLKVGDTAAYKCELGHRLVGNKTLRCELGGQWSSAPPTCLFVDCGLVPAMEHGQVGLLNSSTTFGSMVTYVCDQDYQLQGQSRRVCQEDGTWSAAPPTCKLIQCDEPSVPSGGLVTGFDFTVHSTISYHCEAGHQLIGQKTSKCLPARTWSNPAPLCVYVDCGQLPSISNGEVVYTNGTTHLGSEATYSCNQHFQLESADGSNDIRRCTEEGKWSGIPPHCREIRCSIPERPDGAVLSISSSDRLRAVTLLRATDRDSSSTSFRIGSNVVYKCERGFRLDGKNARTCNEGGQWTGEAPVCTFVDCGSPEETAHGQVGLPSNATYFGSYAQYTCDTNYKLEGFERRMCLENGSWSASPPTCKEITCVSQITNDTTSGMSASVSSLSVGGVATYTCSEGRRIVGPLTRKCLATGLWDGQQPFCEWVDCSQPEEAENGRVFLVNSSTTYGSVAEYHCVQGFQRHGSFSRKCGADAKWAGPVPRCIEEGKPIPPLSGNGLDSLSSERNQSSGTGIWIGVGIGAALVLLLLLAIVFLKMKRGAWGKSPYPKPASKKRSAMVMSPPNIPLPPTPQATFTNPPGHQSGMQHPAVQIPHLGFPYSSSGDIYEHLPGENHHMYDLTYEDTQSTRQSRANGSVLSSGSPRPRSPPPSPPAGVTVNGFVLS